MKAQKYINDLQAKAKADAVLGGYSAIKQKRFESQEIVIANRKVIKLAETVYNSYLSQGEEIATERRNLYIKRNLK